MSRNKNKTAELTRAALESHLWTATGWRGDPAVIDSILGKIDVYAANRIRQAGIEAQERAEAVAVGAEQGKMTAELPVDAPISQKVLDALVDAMEAARSATTHAARAVMAVEVATQAIREAHEVASSGEDPADAVGAQSAADDEPGQTDRVPEAAEAPATLGIAETLGAGDSPADLSEHEQAMQARDVTAPDAIDADDAEADAIVDAILNGTEESSAPEGQWAEIDATTGQPVGPAVLGEPDRDGDKRCTKCEHIKAYSEFYRDKQAADGYKGSCKKCDAKRTADRAHAARRGDAERAVEARLAVLGE